MIASVLVSARRRDCLHQTPIEAQPPQSGGAGPRPAALETNSYPHAVPFKELTRGPEDPGQLSAGSGEGQSSHL